MKKATGTLWTCSKLSHGPGPKSLLLLNLLKSISCRKSHLFLGTYHSRFSFPLSPNLFNMCKFLLYLPVFLPLGLFLSHFLLLFAFLLHSIILFDLRQVIPQQSLKLPLLALASPLPIPQPVPPPAFHHHPLFSPLPHALFLLLSKTTQNIRNMI